MNAEVDGKANHIAEVIRDTEQSSDISGDESIPFENWKNIKFHTRLQIV